eukprot:1159115-Pelagomonas_calceolata.AAC.7
MPVGAWTECRWDCGGETAEVGLIGRRLRAIDQRGNMEGQDSLNAMPDRVVMRSSSCVFPSLFFGGCYFLAQAKDV